jgi:hypothetical protein
MKKTIKLSKKLLGAALAFGLSTTLNANAFSAPEASTGADELFSMSEVPTQPNLPDNGEIMCGQSQCGDNDYGADPQEDDTTGPDSSDDDVENTNP